jgi:hypothetical protein
MHTQPEIADGYYPGNGTRRYFYFPVSGLDDRQSNVPVRFQILFRRKIPVPKLKTRIHRHSLCKPDVYLAALIILL